MRHFRPRLILILIWLYRYRKEKRLYKLIQNLEITKEQMVHGTCLKFIKQCRKRRLEFMELSIDICRFCMLYSNLKMPGHKIADPVFIGFCGVSKNQFFTIIFIIFRTKRLMIQMVNLLIFLKY